MGAECKVNDGGDGSGFMCYRLLIIVIITFIIATFVFEQAQVRGAGNSHYHEATDLAHDDMCGMNDFSSEIHS